MPPRAAACPAFARPGSCKNLRTGPGRVCLGPAKHELCFRLRVRVKVGEVHGRVRMGPRVNV
eukprot:15461881-Alexandrium_andersonii.AAC.1